jgi:hypothetical protein
MSLYEKQLQHLIRMASIPGFKEHAWYRAKELSATPEELFLGIDKRLIEEMNARATGKTGPQIQTRIPVSNSNAIGVRGRGKGD